MTPHHALSWQGTQQGSSERERYGARQAALRPERLDPHTLQRIGKSQKMKTHSEAWQPGCYNMNLGCAAPIGKVVPRAAFLSHAYWYPYIPWNMPMPV